jgi:SAM-dependent methyltransferase
MTQLSEQIIRAKPSIRRGLQTWKIPPILKGSSTWLPVLNAWRKHRASTGGTDTPRYCYSVWLRHLAILHAYGFKIAGPRVGELGPGDSIGIGLAALLSGATQYVGLDIVPFSANANLEGIFDELVNLYSRREPIPDNDEFPRLRPRLDSFEFPGHLIDLTDFAARAKGIRDELRTILNGSRVIKYQAPWTSPNDIAPASLDLIFSQAVLEHVDNLEETYQAMFAWLKPGGYASHVIDFSAHHLSPFWNGHWAYSDLQWRLVRGRREFLLNRQPLSRHLECAENVGFGILALDLLCGDNGLKRQELSQRFQVLDDDDVQTRGAILILQKC